MQFSARQFFRHIAKINDLLNLIAKAFEGVTGTSNEYAELREAKANFEELQRRWNDALADATETFNGAQGAQNAENAKNSMRKSAKSIYNDTDTQYNSVTKKLVAAGILSVNDQSEVFSEQSEQYQAYASGLKAYQDTFRSANLLTVIISRN